MFLLKFYKNYKMLGALLLLLLMNFNYNSAVGDINFCKDFISDLNLINPNERGTPKFCESVSSQLSYWLFKSVADAPMKLEFNLTTSKHRFPLNLEKIDHTLFNKNTKIIFGNKNNSTSEDERKRLTQENIFSVAPKLKDVVFYRQYNITENHSAFMVYMADEGYFVMEGFIGDYTLRYLPKKREYILYKLNLSEKPPITGNVDNQKIVTYDLHSANYAETAYIPLLIALDHTFVINRKPFEVLKNVFLYYNAVDMIYANFTRPQIKLYISAVIIPSQSFSVDYIPKVQINNIDQVDEIKMKNKSYFIDSKNDIFSSYHNIIIMTGSSFSISKNEFSFYHSFKKSNDFTFQSCLRHFNFAGEYAEGVNVIYQLLSRKSDGNPTKYLTHPRNRMYKDNNKDDMRFIWFKDDHDAMSNHFSLHPFAKTYPKSLNSGSTRSISPVIVKIFIFMTIFKYTNFF